MQAQTNDYTYKDKYWSTKISDLSLSTQSNKHPWRATAGKIYMTAFIFQQDPWLIQGTEETLFNKQNIE